MPNIVIDLNTKRVPETIRVWRLFPGASYKFLRYFRDAGVVFFDYPGLLLPPGPINDQTPQSKIDLRSRLLVTDAVSSWIAEMRQYRQSPTGVIVPTRPERDLGFYRGRDAQSGLSREMGGLVGLFGKAAKGDLIIVPGRSREHRVYVGEFTSGPEDRVLVDLGDSYEGENTLARAVKWFPPVPEFRFPEELSGMLRTQTAWLEVPDGFRLSFLDATYGTYIFKEHFASQLRTFSELFSGQDALDLTVLAKIAARLASDFEGRRPLDANISSIILDPLPEDDQLAISISINSPGYVITKAATIGPIALVALFMLFARADAEQKPSGSQVTVVNSGSTADDPCVANVNNLVSGALDVMGMADWQTACRLAQRLATHPQLRSDAKIVNQQ